MQRSPPAGALLCGCCANHEGHPVETRGCLEWPEDRLPVGVESDLASLVPLQDDAHVDRVADGRPVDTGSLGSVAAALPDALAIAMAAAALSPCEANAVEGDVPDMETRSSPRACLHVAVVGLPLTDVSGSGQAVDERGDGVEIELDGALAAAGMSEEQLGKRLVLARHEHPTTDDEM